MDFDGYYNLMNHRKNVHPSNKKCRKFPNNCPHGNECWYVHSEKESSTQKLSDEFKCEQCDKTISGRRNFMMHKKINHIEIVQPCNLFRSNQCKKNEKTCWFDHNVQNQNHNTYADVLKSSTQNNSREIPVNNQVFQQVTENTHPPEKVDPVLEMMTKMLLKMENMELRIQSLMK